MSHGGCCWANGVPLEFLDAEQCTSAPLPLAQEHFLLFAKGQHSQVKPVPPELRLKRVPPTSTRRQCRKEVHWLVCSFLGHGQALGEGLPRKQVAMIF